MIRHERIEWPFQTEHDWVASLFGRVLRVQYLTPVPERVQRVKEVSRGRR